MKTLGMLVILLGAASFAVAGTPRTPEIDGSSAYAAVAVVSGGLLILRARKKK